MDADCVNIITRTKDRPLLVWRSIESVLDQSHQNWKHVIVNDGGDRIALQRILDKYGERYRGRIKLIHNHASLGAGPALNIGMMAADSEYIVTHDDDDSWAPDFLERSIEALKIQKRLVPNTRGIITHTNAVHEYIDGERVIEKFRYSFNGWVRTVTLTRLCASNFIPPISFLFERSVFSEIGFFDEKIHPVEDWEFYLRFLAKFDIGLLPAHLANYHFRTEGANIYANTVTLGIERHRMIMSALRNNLIREDLSSGKFGLGYLVALSSSAPFAGQLKHSFWNMRKRWCAALNPRALFKRFFPERIP